MSGDEGDSDGVVGRVRVVDERLPDRPVPDDGPILARWRKQQDKRPRYAIHDDRIWSINYRDEEGDETWRRIKVTSVTYAHDFVPILTCSDLSVNDTRSFRLDRILKITDAEGVKIKGGMREFWLRTFDITWPERLSPRALAWMKARGFR